MRENGTKNNQEKLTYALTPDDERQYDITLRAISKMDETTHNCEYLMSLAMIKRITTVLEENNTLDNTLNIKYISDKLLSYACEGIYATICDGHTDDHDYCSKSMMDLIMIIIRKHGGAISSQTLDRLFGNSDEYLQALGSMIGLGMVKYATQVNGKVICYYIPID